MDSAINGGLPTSRGVCKSRKNHLSTTNPVLAMTEFMKKILT